MMALNDLTGPSAGPLARIPYCIHSFIYQEEFALQSWLGNALKRLSQIISLYHI